MILEGVAKSPNPPDLPLGFQQVISSPAARERVFANASFLNIVKRRSKEPNIHIKHSKKTPKQIFSSHQLHREKKMPTTMDKKQAHKMIDRMHSNASWEDLMCQIYVQAAIESGLSDSKAGHTKDVQEIRDKYGLTE